MVDFDDEALARPILDSNSDSSDPTIGEAAGARSPGSNMAGRRTKKGSTPRYQIGTVATLTGLDPHTIRAWERRHGAVEPDRTDTGRRMYGEAAVERLQLLKALVDCGEAIGQVASLSDETLRKRLHSLAGLAEASPGERKPLPKRRALRLGLLAPSVGAQMRSRPSGSAGLEIRTTRDDVESFLDALAEERCDVLVIELEKLGAEPGRALDACLEAAGAQLAVIVYTFARAGELTRLARRGARLVRGPVRVDLLRQTILDGVASDAARKRRLPSATVPRAARVPAERRFNDAQLAQLAESSTSVDCECPNHLSALVSALVSFERYSRDCESRDDADAAMHGELALGTGRARAVMEQLLEGLCEYEGISV